MYINVIFAFVVGTVIGSFLNVVILRADRLASILNTRSECPQCHTKLGWKDLVPVVSFLLLRGRCRYCKQPISWQYPLMEIAVGFMYAILALFFGLTPAFAFYAVVFSLLAVVFVHDLQTQLVPEEFVWAALIIAVLGSASFGGFDFNNMLLGGLVAGGLPALLVVVSREQWMGAGDIKISLILGLLLGYPRAVLGMFLAFFLGAIIGVLYIYLGKKTMKDSLPFGPFIITAAYVSLLLGDYIMMQYTNWFGVLY